MDKIAGHRKEIDQIHKELYALLQRRRDSVMAIWKIKQATAMPFFNAEREQQILQDFVKLSENSGTDPQFDELTSAVMNTILREYEKYLRSKFPQGSE